MAQTSGRYPIIDYKHAAGTLYGICMMKDMIEFLEGWDAKSDVDIVPPGKRLTHNQYKLLIGRAAKTLEAVLLYGGTMDEIERATKIALIAIDSEKYWLDVEQAKAKYGFKELEDKYARGIQE